MEYIVNNNLDFNHHNKVFGVLKLGESHSKPSFTQL